MYEVWMMTSSVETLELEKCDISTGPFTTAELHITNVGSNMIGQYNLNYKQKPERFRN